MVFEEYTEHMCTLINESSTHFYSTAQWDGGLTDPLANDLYTFRADHSVCFELQIINMLQALVSLKVNYPEQLRTDGLLKQRKCNLEKNSLQNKKAESFEKCKQAFGLCRFPRNYVASYNGF